MFPFPKVVRNDLEVKLASEWGRPFSFTSTLSARMVIKDGRFGRCTE